MTKTKMVLDRLTLLLLCFAALCVVGVGWERLDGNRAATPNAGSPATGTMREVGEARLAAEVKALTIKPSAFYNLTLSGDSVGQSDADVVIVVYSDFSCGHCATFYATLERLLRRYPDELLIIYKHYLSLSGNGGVLQLGLAADCAADQHQYEAYARAAFEFPELVGSRRGWMTLADSAHISDRPAFVACTRSEEHRDRADDDMQQAGALQITGTPTSFVNGIRIVGDLSLGTLDTLVAFELGRLQPNRR